MKTLPTVYNAARHTTPAGAGAWLREQALLVTDTLEDPQQDHTTTNGWLTNNVSWNKSTSTHHALWQEQL